MESEENEKEEVPSGRESLELESLQETSESTTEEEDSADQEEALQLLKTIEQTGGASISVYALTWNLHGKVKLFLLSSYSILKIESNLVLYEPLNDWDLNYVK